MGALKKILKERYVQLLPTLVRRVSMEERVDLFQKTLGMQNYSALVSREECWKILTLAARRLDVPSFSVSGDLGIYEGSIADENVHGRYALEGRWAPGLQRVLINAIFKNKQGTYLDIGANIGLTSIPVAKATAVDCIAFEPEPRNFAYLRRNIITNEVEGRIALHNCALFSTNSSLDFELSAYNLGDHRVRVKSPAELNGDEFREASRAVIRISARKLDDLLDAKDLAKPLVMKIDTQGSELQVLKGAKSFLRSVDFLFVEFWPYGLLRMGDSPDVLLDELIDFEYGSIVEFDEETPSIEPELIPINVLVQRLRAFARDTSGTNYVDVLLSRHATFDLVS